MENCEERKIKKSCFGHLLANMKDCKPLTYCVEEAVEYDTYSYDFDANEDNEDNLRFLSLCVILNFSLFIICNLNKPVYATKFENFINRYFTYCTYFN